MRRDFQCCMLNAIASFRELMWCFAQPCGLHLPGGLRVFKHLDDWFRLWLQLLQLRHHSAPLLPQSWWDRRMFTINSLSNKLNYIGLRSFGKKTKKHTVFSVSRFDQVILKQLQIKKKKQMWTTRSQRISVFIVSLLLPNVKFGKM